MSSNIAVKEIEHCRQLIVQKETDFNEIAKIHGAVNFKKECAFALQSLEKNNFLMNTAKSNPMSLGHAIMNVATIGLSLNPVHKMAYLVPRNKEVCLDISYMGLVQLAIDCGIVVAVEANIIYEKDIFKKNALGLAPTHEYDECSEDRGKIKGVVCVALDSKGFYHKAVMKIADVYKIRDRSDGYKAFKDGRIKSNPWVTDEEEMIKKTSIKRGYKMWPKLNSKEAQRFAEAIDVTNSADPIDFSATESKKVDAEIINDDLFLEVKTCIEISKRSNDQFIDWAKKTFRREDISEVESLTTKECEQAISFLKGVIEKEAKKTSPLPKEKDEKKEGK